MTLLRPRRDAPPFTVKLARGGQWSLHQAASGRWAMIVVYRGLHCGICKGYVRRLAALRPAFAAADVEVLAVSSDPHHKAVSAIEEWALGDLAVGYDLSFETARPWGVFASAARKAGEPETFFEPAVFVAKPDRTLFFAAVQNMPFARPDLAETLTWILQAQAQAIPARGELDLAAT